MACQHFRHGVDQHCRTLVACNIRQQLLQQGQHLTKTCKLWAPTWQSTAGWAPEMG
ncbi:putative kelch motif [Synechococcus sp. SYN20]|nr:putative kelch motif [Synechococcus sp. MVIR-18-1]QNJ26351.1 putative kelch motif [Synechococcus sp. SYN20]